MNVATQTREFRFKPTKGPYEPWYCGVLHEDTGYVLKKWWECPHCGGEFRTRKACEQHAKGKQNQFPPTCHQTKKGGKCYGGCTHE